MSSALSGPAPRPCASCPYRRDVPSGVWAAEEYAKLRRYDEQTPFQPREVFLCHQTGADSEHRRMCAGWTGCHGGELLALRLAAAGGRITADGYAAAAGYVSPEPLFGSGGEAADHGESEIASPSSGAAAVIGKITRRRNDIGGGQPSGNPGQFESISDPCELAGRAEPCLACLGYCTGELHDPRWFKKGTDE